MRRYVLENIAILSPVVDEGKVKTRRIDPVKRQDVFMG